MQSPDVHHFKYCFREFKLDTDKGCKHTLVMANDSNIFEAETVQLKSRRIPHYQQVSLQTSQIKLK